MQNLSAAFFAQFDRMNQVEKSLLPAVDRGFDMDNGLANFARIIIGYFFTFTCKLLWKAPGAYDIYRF